jgi:hypothetical protein
MMSSTQLVAHEKRKSVNRLFCSFLLFFPTNSPLEIEEVERERFCLPFFQVQRNGNKKKWQEQRLVKGMTF